MTNSGFNGESWKQSVVCSHPTTPASNDPVRLGVVCGVAAKAEDAAGLTSVNFGPGVFSVSVKGANDAGNSAVAPGDQIFYVDADTPVLSKKQTSQATFGIALEAVTSGATATIKVLRGVPIT